MFEDFKNVEEINSLGIEPLKSIAECIRIHYNESEIVDGLVNAAIGILEDLSKCLERLADEQRSAQGT